MDATDVSSIATPRLPPEIIDFILEDLRPDPTEDFPSRIHDDGLVLDSDLPHPNHDLASCALVCRDWRELSRRHLFHTIAFSFRPVSDRRSPEEFALFLRDDQKSLKSLDKFVDFLEENRQLAQFIANLTLSMDPLENTYLARDLSMLRYDSPRLIYRLISALSSAHLRVLNLWNILLADYAFQSNGADEDSETDEDSGADEGVGAAEDTRTSKKEPRSSWTKSFPHLTSVTLRYNLHPGVYPHSIFNILTLFTSIDALTLWDVKLGQSLSNEIIPEHLKFKKLITRSSTSQLEMVPGDTDDNGIKEITSISVDPSQSEVGQGDIEAINNLLRHGGTRLKQFSYKLTPSSEGDIDDLKEVDFSLDFSFCDHLEKITLSFTVYPFGYERYSEYNQFTWSSLTSILTGHPPPNLKYVEFIIEQIPGYLEVFEWDTPEITELESVLFNMSSLLNVHLSPGFNRNLSARRNRNGRNQTRPNEGSMTGPHNWIDAEFSLKLFCGLSTVDKLSVGGSNSLYRNTSPSSALPEYGRMVLSGSPSLQEDFLKEAERRRKIHLGIDSQ